VKPEARTIANTMQEAQVRRFMTVLFVTRAKRHLKTLAELYGWSPETLASYEEEFIRVADFVPVWSESGSG
jgi:hypothetical protein